MATSSETRLATDMAATRRGWVQPTMPLMVYPSSIRYCNRRVRVRIKVRVRRGLRVRVRARVRWASIAGADVRRSTP
jgi:hypothetical protein